MGGFKGLGQPACLLRCVVLGVSAMCLECGSTVQQAHVELASLVLEEAMCLPELFRFYSAFRGLEEATCLGELLQFYPALPGLPTILWARNFLH